jgi:RmuC family
MSEQIGIVVLALIAGLVGGVALAALRRPAAVTRPPSADEAVAAARIQGQLESQSAELRRIADATAGRDVAGQQLREGLEAARRGLEQLHLRDQERRVVEDEHREVVKRLSTVLAGGTSKGRAGENLLREHLSQLPPGMLVTDFRVGGKVVEFGLLLPDGRRLPIDSKWTALAELEALQAAEEPAEREACVRAVEKAVVLRAREVAQYLDPALTAPVAVAAVPDAAYEVLKRAHADAFAFGVVIVPYASALPIVLFLYSLVQRFGDAADVQAGLAEIANVLDILEGVVENKFARAGTMIANGADEFRSQLGKARGTIARARTAELPAAVPVAALDPDAEPLSVVR